MPKFQPGNKVGKTFKKGQSGNPKGRPPKLPDLEPLLAKVLGEEKNNISAMEAILSALRLKAAKGDVRAAEVLLNRGYGLQKQQVDTSGEVTVVIRREDGAKSYRPQDTPSGTGGDFTES